MNIVDDHPASMPSAGQVSDWLRQHVKKKRPGLFARWMGEPAEFTYEVGPPRSVPVRFIRRQLLFTVLGEMGLFPYRALPSRSWGIFAADGGELFLLEPEPSSLSALLAREGRPLDEGDPTDLAQLFCLILLSGAHSSGHDVVQSPNHLRAYTWNGLEGYRVNEASLQSVANQIVPPSIRGTVHEGWTLEFATVAGWMHETNELGIERFAIAPDFNVSRSARRILHNRIFSETPHIMY